jgi:hypothetical protein
MGPNGWWVEVALAPGRAYMCMAGRIRMCESQQCSSAIVYCSVPLSTVLFFMGRCLLGALRAPPSTALSFRADARPAHSCDGVGGLWGARGGAGRHRRIAHRRAPYSHKRINHRPYIKGNNRGAIAKASSLPMPMLPFRRRGREDGGRREGTPGRVLTGNWRPLVHWRRSSSSRRAHSQSGRCASGARVRLHSQSAGSRIKRRGEPP